MGGWLSYKLIGTGYNIFSKVLKCLFTFFSCFGNFPCELSSVLYNLQLADESDTPWDKEGVYQIAMSSRTWLVMSFILELAVDWNCYPTHYSSMTSPATQIVPKHRFLVMSIVTMLSRVPGYGWPARRCLVSDWPNAPGAGTFRLGKRVICHPRKMQKILETRRKPPNRWKTPMKIPVSCA